MVIVNIQKIQPVVISLEPAPFAMTVYKKNELTISLVDAQKGLGSLAKKYRGQDASVRPLEKSQPFKAYGRDSKYQNPYAIQSHTEIRSPPKLQFVKKKPTVFSLQKSLLKLDETGNIIKNQSPIRSRFSPIKKTRDNYYPDAMLNKSIGQRYKNMMDYQQLQTDNYAKLNKGSHHIYHSACFDAPYKGQRIDPTASKMFGTRSLSLSHKEIMALTMGIPSYEQDYYLSHTDSSVIRSTTSLNNSFSSQTNRNEDAKFHAVGKELRTDKYNFDYSVPPPKKKLAYIPDFSKVPGRDGKVPTDVPKQKKYWTTSQLYRSFSSMK